MTTRDEAIDIGSRSAFDAFYAEGTLYTEIERAMFKQISAAVYDALFAAGVIPAEGSVVDIELRDAVKSIMNSWNSLDDGRYAIEEREFTALAMAWSKIAPDDVLVVDLDAIPDAPTGEGKR